MNKRALLIILFSLILGLAGCGSTTTATSADVSETTGDTTSSSTAVSSGEIKIGATLPLSGWGANYGKEAQQAMQLAVDQINASGGINGNQLKLIVEDSAADAKTAVSATQKLISVDKVVGIVGTMFTSEALPQAPIVTAAKIPLILGQANSPAITEASEFIFMPHPTAIGDFQTVVTYGAERKNVKRLAFLGPDNDFSRVASEVAKTTMAELGGQLVSSEYYPTDTSDFKTLLAQVKAAEADGLALNGSSQDISRIIRQASELGMAPVYMGSSQLGDTSIIDTVGNLAEGAFYAEVHPMTEAGNKVRADFLAAYTEKYGAPATVTPYYAYDGLNLMAEAIKAVGTDGTKIKDWLTALTDHNGTCGELSFGGSNVAEMAMFTFEVQEGKFVQTDFSLVVK